MNYSYVLQTHTELDCLANVCHRKIVNICHTSPLYQQVMEIGLTGRTHVLGTLQEFKHHIFCLFLSRLRQHRIAHGQAVGTQKGHARLVTVHVLLYCLPDKGGCRGQESKLHPCGPQQSLQAKSHSGNRARTSPVK